MLRDLPEVWTSATEGPSTWSPYVVIGHLIHCERADWMPRLAIILEHGPGRPFDPFDREAQFRESNGKSLPMLLDEFSALRRDNLARLQTL
ncbi:MAG: DinB family protein, partial [Bryobacteraceae bacterium]